MTPQKPYFWLRNLSSGLAQMGELPPLGHISTFDVKSITDSLASVTGLKNISLREINQGYRTAEQLTCGLSEDVIVLPLKISPLSGSAYWICSRADVEKLTSWISKPLSTGTLAAGFYRYLVLQTLNALFSIEPFHEFSPVLSESTPLPQTDSFCVDIEIQCAQGTCIGRLAFDPELRKDWILSFSHPSDDAALPRLAEVTPVVIGVKVGSSILRRDEWEGIQKGDFIALDVGSYDPRKHAGAAYLMLGDAPLFSLKVKNNKIQLIDYAFIQEETMTDNAPPEDPTLTENLEEETGEVASLKELPVHLVVEIARYKISLEKLMQLAPGSLIELPVHPDQAVKLTINGQLVGHAELVHLGETLGIRILDLG